jgi:hypothetical protein
MENALPNHQKHRGKILFFWKRSGAASFYIWFHLTCMYAGSLNFVNKIGLGKLDMDEVAYDWV